MTFQPRRKGVITERFLVETTRYGATLVSWLWINCEFGGMVGDDIFPDTLLYKHPYFSPFAFQTS